MNFDKKSFHIEKMIWKALYLNEENGKDGGKTWEVKLEVLLTYQPY